MRAVGELVAIVVLSICFGLLALIALNAFRVRRCERRVAPSAEFAALQHRSPQEMTQRTGESLYPQSRGPSSLGVGAAWSGHAAAESGIGPRADSMSFTQLGEDELKEQNTGRDVSSPLGPSLWIPSRVPSPASTLRGASPAPSFGGIQRGSSPSLSVGGPSPAPSIEGFQRGPSPSLNIGGIQRGPSPSLQRGPSPPPRIRAIQRGPSPS